MYLIVNSKGNYTHEIYHNPQYSRDDAVREMRYLINRLPCQFIGDDKIIVNCTLSVVKYHIAQYEDMVNRVINSQKFKNKLRIQTFLVLCAIFMIMLIMITVVILTIRYA